MTKTIELDESNSLKVPALHDARLYRVDFGGKQVACFFEDPTGERVKLLLQGVVQMSSRELAEANILLDVSVETGREVREEILGRLLSSATPAQERHRDAVLKRLHDGELKLLHFSPSYGGEITVICETVTWSRAR
jgi:hypothetical protein